MKLAWVKKMGNIIYIHPHYSTFVKKDISILNEVYSVTAFEFNPNRKISVLFLFIKQLFFLIKNTSGSSLIICQFAGYHSLLPVIIGKLFNVPSLLILGGTDCSKFPSINYGNFNKRILSWFTYLSLKKANHLSPVSESLIEYAYTYQPNDYPKQGYKYFYPDIKTQSTVIYNGYDPHKYFKTRKTVSNSFLTIAFVEKNRFALKGIDLILAIAPRFTNCKFTIVSKVRSEELENIPSNVQLIPPIENNSLKDLFSQHQYYFQLSISEGFPNALCEAMLCECVPIGSNVGAIPLIIGNTGYILTERDIDKLSQLIEQIIKTPDTKSGKNARERIIQKFPESTRKKELLELCKKLIIKK